MGTIAFFLFLTQNEAAALARYDGYGSNFYILKFGNGSGHGDNVDRLWWKYEPSLTGSGGVFQRKPQDQSILATEQTFDL